MKNIIASYLKTKFVQVSKYLPGQQNQHIDKQELITKGRGLEEELEVNKKLQQEISIKQEVKMRELQKDTNLLSEQRDKVNNNTEALIGIKEEKAKNLIERLKLLKALRDNIESLVKYSKKDLESAQKALGDDQEAEEKHQKQVTHYTCQLEKDRAELKSIKDHLQNFCNKLDKSNINLESSDQPEALEATAKALQEKANLITKSQVLEKNINDQKTLKYAEEIKLKNCQDDIGIKKEHISDIQATIKDHEKTLAEIATEIINIKDRKLELTAKLSQLKEIIKPDEDGNVALSPRRLSNCLQGSNLSPQGYSDKTEEEEEEEEKKSPRDFQQESPRTRAFREISKLLQSDFRQAEEIKLELFSLIKSDEVEEFYEFLSGYASKETGLIEKKQLDDLKQSEKFSELCNLIKENLDSILLGNAMSDNNTWQSLYKYNEEDAQLYKSQTYNSAFSLSKYNP
jgi:hypothetical protein